MKIPPEIRRELGSLTKTTYYKSIRAFWYRRLAEISWMITIADEKSVPRLQGRADEIKQQIQTLVMIDAEGEATEKIFDDELEKQVFVSNHSRDKLINENAILETETKERIIEKSEDELSIKD